MSIEMTADRLAVREAHDRLRGALAGYSSPIADVFRIAALTELLAQMIEKYEPEAYLAPIRLQAEECATRLYPAPEDQLFAAAAREGALLALIGQTS